MSARVLRFPSGNPRDRSDRDTMPVRCTMPVRRNDWLAVQGALIFVELAVDYLTRRSVSARTVRLLRRACTLASELQRLHRLPASLKVDNLMIEALRELDQVLIDLSQRGDCDPLFLEYCQLQLDLVSDLLVRRDLAAGL